MVAISTAFSRHPSVVYIGLLITFITVAVLFWLSREAPEETLDIPVYRLFTKLSNPVDIVIGAAGVNSGQPRQDNCTYHSCFDVYRCSQDDRNQIKVYIYPYYRFFDEGSGVEIGPPLLSQEYFEVLEAISESPYMTEDPAEACLFVPVIDTLNEEVLSGDPLSRMLAALPHWSADGRNHLLFSMLVGCSPDFHTAMAARSGRALLATAGMSTYTYRRTFDVSLPLFDSYIQTALLDTATSGSKRWTLISAQQSLHIRHASILETMYRRHPADILYLTSCVSSDQHRSGDATADNPLAVTNKRCSSHHTGSSVTYNYPDVLARGKFCLVLPVDRLAQSILLDSMRAGCVPIIVTDFLVLPFSEVLDWKRVAILIHDVDIEHLVEHLQSLSLKKLESLQQQVKFLYETYFSSMYQITLTTLQIINDRVFPYAAKTYEAWNNPPEKVQLTNPLFWPRIAPKTAGFTAVILTYDRLDSLFEVILQVAKAPSLAKVLVVWNNQKKAPPQASAWPKISKPLKVVQTQENKLSNRFYPYDEIETEAIFALDDDIIMLTADEIQFAYDVWREFPDRLVGFPSRLHLYNASEGRWKYESEWTNDISMVLTGAAIYHKYYSFLYTSAMPGGIKAWVDERMNCEDIAMNFLIANTTGKPPIKVAPRKKFKCPEATCRNVDISADLSHMVERSECINKFTQIYGGVMPLKTVEFRADPVLYKDDDVAEQFKKYRDIGSL